MELFASIVSIVSIVSIGSIGSIGSMEARAKIEWEMAERQWRRSIYRDGEGAGSFSRDDGDGRNNTNNNTNNIEALILGLCWFS